VINKTQETVAALTLGQFEQVCDQVDAQLAEVTAEVFAQKRTRLKAAKYVETLCRDDVPVKSCWDMAEAAGYEQPRPFQSLMSVNEWDCDLLWAAVAHLASASLACPAGDPLGPGIAVDESGQPKRGRHSAGVGVQYAGFAGGKVNCVTSVALSLIIPSASTWVGNELFLQEKEWFSGEGDKGAARRRSAGVAADLEFESKPDIARRKLAQLRVMGVTFTWAAGDEVYGRSSKLRKDHEDNEEAYAYFVPRDFMVELPCGARARADEVLGLAEGRFEVRACGNELNGPRLYAWAMIATASPEHFLVIRRVLDGDPDPAAGRETGDRGARDKEDGEAARNPAAGKLPPGTGFMYCHVPESSPIAPSFSNLLLMIGRRWPVEETIAVGKGSLGWDHNQFRKYESIRRHNALSGMAMLRANLIRIGVEAKLSDEAGAGHDAIPEQAVTATSGSFEVTPFSLEDTEPEECLIPLGDAAVPHSADEECPQDIGCIRLSVAETLRLVNIARSEATAARKQILLRWSMWRRRHQAIARWHHRRARLAAP
jgi:SRSO17 transposase